MLYPPHFDLPPSSGQFPPRYEGLRPGARLGSSIPIMTHREPIMTGFCPSSSYFIIITIIVTIVNINIILHHGRQYHHLSSPSDVIIFVTRLLAEKSNLHVDDGCYLMCNDG